MTEFEGMLLSYPVGVAEDLLPDRAFAYKRIDSSALSCTRAPIQRTLPSLCPTPCVWSPGAWSSAAAATWPPSSAFCVPVDGVRR